MNKSRKLFQIFSKLLSRVKNFFLSLRTLIHCSYVSFGSKINKHEIKLKNVKYFQFSVSFCIVFETEYLQIEFSVTKDPFIYRLKIGIFSFSAVTHDSGTKPNKNYFSFRYYLRKRRIEKTRSINTILLEIFLDQKFNVYIGLKYI